MPALLCLLLLVADDPASLRAAAAAGELDAAARMVALARWEDMAAIPVHDPAVRAWIAADSGRDDMSGRQVYGDVLANWVIRHPDQVGDDAAKLMAEAQAHVDSAPVGDPVLLRELGWLVSEWEPIDAERAHALFVEAYARLQQPVAGDPLLAAVRRFGLAEMDAMGEGTARDDALAAERFLEAADLAEEAGDVHLQARALRGAARAADPVALDLLDEAVALFEEVGAADDARETRREIGEARLAQAGSPVDLRRAELAFDEAGDAAGRARALLARAILLAEEDAAEPALFGEAAVLFARVGDPGGQGDALHRLAAVHRDAGRWLAAAALYRRAGERRADAGDLAGLAESLRAEALCRGDGSLEAPNARQRYLLARAEEAYSTSRSRR